MVWSSISSFLKGFCLSKRKDLNSPLTKGLTILILFLWTPSNVIATPDSCLAFYKPRAKEVIQNILPAAHYPELYNYGDVYIYRAFSWKVDRPDSLQSYLNLDNPNYNDLDLATRAQEISQIMKTDGITGLVRHQARQSRMPIQDRLTMAASEEIGQVIHLERYGKTQMKSDFFEPSVRVIAEIKPDPHSDPILLMRTAAPTWAQKEAGYFFSPDESAANYYIVVTGKNESVSYYKVGDASQVKTKMSHALSGAPKEGRVGAEKVLEETIKHLEQAGLVTRDQVLESLAPFDARTINLERDLRSLAKRYDHWTFTSALENLRDLAHMAPSLAKHKDDLRVQRIVKILQDRLAYRFQEIKDAGLWSRRFDVLANQLQKIISILN